MFDNQPTIINKLCVPEEQMHKNIIKNLHNINHWILPAKCHSKSAIIVSAGETIDFDKLKQIISEHVECKVFCVKHSYKKLLAQDIKPWACVIVDPRPIDGISSWGHKRIDLLTDGYLGTNFFVASTSNTDYTPFLKSIGYNIIGFHNSVDEMYKWIKIPNNEVDMRMFLEKPQYLHQNPNLNIDQITHFLQYSISHHSLSLEGSCAAIAAINIAIFLGFRDIHLFGFDCNKSTEPTEEEKKEINQFGYLNYYNLGYNGKQFWTHHNLIVQTHELEFIFKEYPSRYNVDIKFYGENTLGAEVWKLYKDFNYLLNPDDIFR